MSTTVLTPDLVTERLQWRYATKKFDPSKKIPSDIWDALVQSLVLAPSSFGLQPWKFFVVRNPELREQLLPSTWNQNQVVDASHLVVFAIKKDVDAADVDRFIDRMAEVQSVPASNLQGYAGVVKKFLQEPPYPLDMNEWSTRQVYIALAQFMDCAALLGVDTCPMEGFQPSEYNKVLGLPEQGYAAVVLCTAGYRAEDDGYADKPKVRYPEPEVVAYVD